jgi:hypothetical protein
MAVSLGYKKYNNLPVGVKYKVVRLFFSAISALKVP